jgi:hypothetical protein
MNEEENITKYLLRVDEIVNTIILGEELDEKIIVQKVMKKKLTIRKNIKRVNPNEKINSIRKIKTIILKKTVAHLT